MAPHCQAHVFARVFEAPMHPQTKVGFNPHRLLRHVLGHSHPKLFYFCQEHRRSDSLRFVSLRRLHEDLAHGIVEVVRQQWTQPIVEQCCVQFCLVGNESLLQRLKGRMPEHRLRQCESYSHRICARIKFEERSRHSDEPSLFVVAEPYFNDRFFFDTLLFKRASKLTISLHYVTPARLCDEMNADPKIPQSIQFVFI